MGHGVEVAPMRITGYEGLDHACPERPTELFAVYWGDSGKYQVLSISWVLITCRLVLSQRVLGSTEQALYMAVVVHRPTGV